MNCPKCNQRYSCPCNSCKGKGFAFTDDGEHIKCDCWFTASVDYWFNLQLTNNKK